ncbi:MAG: F420-nonreducing hydrogenase [Candidatus Verstraetearchaeota archaeon]|nr:F420-nonreducing hydrogenase [Candidatus Verstraetearchaeota archaeon]
MNSKLTLAIFPLIGCSGCENSLLDIWHVDNVIFNNLEIVYSPILTDFKEPDNVDIGIVTGNVRFHEDVNKLLNWRKKSKLLVAFGSCACYGGIPGLLNLHDIQSVINDVYSPNISFDDYDMPKLIDNAKPIVDFVNIDIAIPGCPPPKNLILKLFEHLLKGEPFILPEKSVCNECPLNTGEDKVIKSIRQFSLEPFTPNECFLEQGVLCLGPIIRAGCDARCIKANTPCRGCMGPIHNVDEAAVKFLSSISSMIDEKSKDIDINKIKDLIGLLYRYTLASSKLNFIKRR